MCASSLLASTYGDANVMNTQQQHGASPHSSSRSGPSKQSGQATAILDQQHAVLVHQRGGGILAAQHRQQLQLPARPPRGDSVEADPLPANPHTELRRHLFAAHQLTNIQWVDQLFSLLPLAAHKLSELLAEMLCLCRWGQEKNTFFNCLFLNKLLRELRILLSEANMADKQALGARGDLFTAHNSKQAHDIEAMVATVSLLEQEGEETTVAAVSPGASRDQGSGRSGQQGGSWRKKKKPRHGGSGQQVAHMVSHVEQARLETGWCFSHFCYGAKGRTCRAPCTWLGN
jgi:hypothetical protein